MLLSLYLYDNFLHQDNVLIKPGKVATSTPKKQVNVDATEGASITKEKAEPIVAFGRPPPLPPVLGPLVALSLLETWWSCDGDDD